MLSYTDWNHKMASHGTESNLSSDPAAHRAIVNAIDTLFGNESQEQLILLADRMRRERCKLLSEVEPWLAQRRDRTNEEKGSSTDQSIFLSEKCPKVKTWDFLLKAVTLTRNILKEPQEFAPSNQSSRLFEGRQLIVHTTFFSHFNQLLKFVKNVESLTDEKLKLKGTSLLDNGKREADSFINEFLTTEITCCKTFKRIRSQVSEYIENIESMLKRDIYNLSQQFNERVVYSGKDSIASTKIGSETQSQLISGINSVFKTDLSSSRLMCQIEKNANAISDEREPLISQLSNDDPEPLTNTNDGNSVKTDRINQHIKSLFCKYFNRFLVESQVPRVKNFETNWYFFTHIFHEQKNLFISNHPGMPVKLGQVTALSLELYLREQEIETDKKQARLIAHSFVNELQTLIKASLVN